MPLIHQASEKKRTPKLRIDPGRGLDRSWNDLRARIGNASKAASYARETPATWQKIFSNAGSKTAYHARPLLGPVRVALVKT